MNTCKICNNEFSDASFNREYEICLPCSMILESKVKAMQDAISQYQEKANATSDPDKKILCFKCMLDYLYEYKVCYYDNEVDVLEQDVDDLIDSVIDCIADARV